MTATIDAVANTLGEFEILAQKTGEWDGAEPVEFSADGVTWLPVWVAMDAAPFPTFARATVRRKNVGTPTTMIVAWAESIPADEEWRALWERKPMKLFGSFALRSAIRHAFRDAVGELTSPDEDTTGPVAGAWDPAPAARDWDAEMLAAADPGALTTLWGEMRSARARTGARERVYKERLAEFGERIQATSAAVARRAPSDYRPPANRAERRAKGRKKGGRR